MNYKKPVKAVVATTIAGSLAGITSCAGNQPAAPQAPEALTYDQEMQFKIDNASQTIDSARNAPTYQKETIVRDGLRVIGRIVTEDLLQLSKTDRGTWNETEISRILQAGILLDNLGSLVNSVGSAEGIGAQIRGDYNQSKRVVDAWLEAYSQQIRPAIAAEVIYGENRSEPGHIGFGDDVCILEDVSWSDAQAALGLTYSPLEIVTRALKAYQTNKAKGESSTAVPIVVDGEGRNVGNNWYDSARSRTNFWREIPAQSRGRGYALEAEGETRFYDENVTWVNAEGNPVAQGTPGAIRRTERRDLSSGLLYLMLKAETDNGFIQYSDANGDTATAPVRDVFDRDDRNGFCQRAWVAPVFESPDAAEEYENAGLSAQLEGLYRGTPASE